MMKKYVFYPVLFSINPILLLFAANITIVPISQLFPIILIIPLVATGLMWLLNKWLHNIHRAGFIVFLITFWFFYYIPIHIWANSIHIGSIFLGTHWILFPLWSLIFLILLSGWLWRKITSPETITFFLNLVCIILVSFSILRIVRDLSPLYLNHPDVNQNMPSRTGLTTMSNLPDVYYIILDGYGREDVIRELYHYDNSSFIQALEDRGFIVASQSQSNYGLTALSLASSLNMKYLTGLPTTITNPTQLIWMINNSETRSFFEHLGYKFVTFSTGYLPTDITNSDYYFSSPILEKSHDLEALMLSISVVAPFIDQGWIDLPISRYSTVQERINYTFKTLESEIPQISSPKMVFVHIIAPHPPFIFDQNGPVSPDEPFVLQDANSFPGSIDEYIQGYVDQLSYINKRVLQATDGILLNSKNPPIIIIQGDHGPGAYLDWNSDENNCLKERFSILNAYYLPQGGVIQVQDDITPVNTFPTILNSYFGTNYPLSENKVYFSTRNSQYNFIDVTDKSQAACDIP